MFIMSPSQKCLNLIERFEGCVLTAYRDAVRSNDHPIGVLTIGYGSTSNVTEGMTITQEQAEERLRIDIEAAARCVDGKVGPPITQNQFDALVSFVFNLGCAAFSTSTLLRKINSGDISGAANEFGRWVRAGDKVLPGLVSRRAAEKSLFQS